MKWWKLAIILGGITWYFRPDRDLGKLVESIGEVHSGMCKTMMGTGGSATVPASTPEWVSMRTDLLDNIGAWLYEE